MTITLAERYAGSLLGLACGDAVGTTVEFRAPGTFAKLTDMIGGGPFELAPGQWTDDTSMALCLAESLLYCKGFDARDQMARYTNWWRWGYFSATGECFDIGNTVQQALRRFEETGNPYAGSSDPMTAGNGSLMRLAPVVLYYFPDRLAVDQYCAESSRTTHAASEAIECCRLFGYLLCLALEGRSRQDFFEVSMEDLKEPRVARLAAGSFLDKRTEEIAGTGYCVASLEAALWCFSRGYDFQSTVLAAANLGDDADTTAAIAGQLAGAYYGVQSIPPAWLERLHLRSAIESYAQRLHTHHQS
jgi:ADP-ribosyl-[dinitrogen reductase] hydrolase